jgi:ribosome-binding protein aMBF1 (putative translation factor)
MTRSVGSSTFGPPPDDSTYRRIKCDLAEAVRRWRLRSEMSPAELARRVHSRAAHVERIESDDPLVTLDLVVRSLIALGATPRDIALEIVRKS